MSDKNTFYEVKHKTTTVGYFRVKENAEKHAEEFSQEIDGYNYPIQIIKREFLDHHVEDDVNS